MKMNLPHRVTDRKRWVVRPAGIFVLSAVLLWGCSNGESPDRVDSVPNEPNRIQILPTELATSGIETNQTITSGADAAAVDSLATVNEPTIIESNPPAISADDELAVSQNPSRLSPARDPIRAPQSDPAPSESLAPATLTHEPEPFAPDPNRIASLVEPADDGAVESLTSLGLEMMDEQSVPVGGEKTFAEIQKLRERFAAVSAHLDEVHRSASETPKVKSGKRKYEIAGRSVLLRNHPEFRQVLIRIDELNRELEGVDPAAAPESMDAVTRARIDELIRLQATVNHFQAETMADPLMAAAHEVLLRGVIEAMVTIDPKAQALLRERDELEARIRTLHQSLVQMHVREAIRRSPASATPSR